MGRKHTRDEQGRFTSTELSSEEAAEMARLRWSKPRQESRETLLAEAGYENEEDAPEHLRVLADIATSGRSGAVAAMRDFLRLTHGYTT